MIKSKFFASSESEEEKQREIEEKLQMGEQETSNVKQEKGRGDGKKGIGVEKTGSRTSFSNEKILHISKDVEVDNLDGVKEGIEEEELDEESNEDFDTFQETQLNEQKISRVTRNLNKDRNQQLFNRLVSIVEDFHFLTHVLA